MARASCSRRITRGREGIIGEDVTHTVRTFLNVPLTVPTTEPFEVRGEGVISWANFEKINLSLEEPYSHPRNLAAGSVRKLDPRESAKRHLEFFAFDLVSRNLERHSKLSQQQFLESNGFAVVPYVFLDVHGDAEAIRETIDSFAPKKICLSSGWHNHGVRRHRIRNQSGSHGHHENRLIALKWEDELHETECTGSGHCDDPHGDGQSDSNIQACGD